MLSAVGVRTNFPNLALLGTYTERHLEMLLPWPTTRGTLTISDLSIYFIEKPSQSFPRKGYQSMFLPWAPASGHHMS
jgi:hypothetical protein